MKLILQALILCSLGLSYAHQHFNIGFYIEGSSIDQINGLYMCTSESRCISIGTSTHNQGMFLLTATNIMVQNQIQKRWYISESLQLKPIVNLFGAIELSPSPHLQLKTWKRLDEGGNFEPLMIITPIQTYLTQPEYVLNFNEEMVASYSESLLMRLWEASYVLLQAQQHPTFDPTTERGRYITQALQTHQFLLDEQLNHIQKHSSNEVILSIKILVTLLKCEYWSSLGINEKAVKCFDTSQVHFCSYWHMISKINASDIHRNYSHYNNGGVSNLHLLGSIRYDKLQLPLSRTALIYLNQERDKQLARHLLLHSLAPKQTLAQLQHTAASTQTLAWKLLAQCLLGACTVALSEVHTEWDALTTEWDALLEVLGRRSDYSLVHSLFSQVSYVLRDQRGNDKEIHRLDQSRTIVTGLLSVGAIEVAVQHVECTLLGYLLAVESKVSSSSAEQLQELLLASPALQLLLPPQDTYDELLNSCNVRAALVLHCLIQRIQSNGATWSMFLGNGDMLSLFLSTVFQVTAPVVLTGSSQSADATGGWMREVAVLRYVLVDTLSRLMSACGGDGGAALYVCVLSDPVSNVGARGMFLLAYQGASLLQEGLATLAQAVGTDYAKFGSGDDCTIALDALSNLLRDNTVPAMYQRLLECMATDTNTILHQSVEDSYEGSDSTVPIVLKAVLPSRRVRVAFLSFFFRRHPVGRLLAKVITGLDNNLFDVHIITKHEQGDMRQNGTTEADAVTNYLRRHIDCAHWFLIPHNVVAAVNLIRSARFDVVIYGDVFMDSFVAHLAKTRLAPVQVLFWGHPFTSGYHSMDYFISSDLFEPPNSFTRSKQFSEQLVLFDSLSFQLFDDSAATVPRISLCPAYASRTVNSPWDSAANCGADNSTASAQRLQHRAQVWRWITAVGYDIYDLPLRSKELASSLGVSIADTDICAFIESLRLYGALQSLFKMHPLFDRAIAGILLADSNAVIVLSRNGKQRVWEESFRQRLQRSIVEQQARAESSVTVDQAISRIVFVDQMKHTHYSALLCGMDVALDTFPFGGGVTLSDALHGCQTAVVPFVTAGQLQSVHRLGTGMAIVLNDSTLARSMGGGDEGSRRLVGVGQVDKHKCAAKERSTCQCVMAVMEAATEHLEQRTVVEYVAVAFAVAASTKQSVLPSSARASIQLELFDNIAASAEWGAFLHTIVGF